MTRNLRLSILLIIPFVGSCDLHRDAGEQGASQSRVTADWVLTSGRIYTVDPQNPWAEAVAIRDRKFLYVGSDAGAEEFVSDSAHRIDLAGRLVIPGMVDGHTHPGYIDLEHYGAALPETSREALLAAVGDYARSHPDVDWIRLCCWPDDLYVHGREGPHKQDLDAVVPDRPVWIASSAWHSYWLNSKALEKLGLDKTTPDPLPGVATYVRDEDGELTGWVKEGAGWQHLASQFDVDSASHEEAVTAFLNTLSENGVMAVYDGGNMGYEDRVYGFLAKLERNGKLPLHYEGTYQIFTPDRRELAIEEMKRLRRAYAGERLRFSTIKLFMDGINENRSAAMLDPYSDDPTYVGHTMLTVDELRDFLLELNRERFDLHVHTIGDLAVRTVLDAVEAAKAAVAGDFYPRVTMAHLEVIDPADLRRIQDLGIIANFTPWWFGARVGDFSERALGEERSARTFAARSLSDLGARVSFSSDDWILTVLSPFLGMEMGQSRQYPKDWSMADGFDTSRSRPTESERLDLEAMIRGYTINGAYQLRMEDQIGSIEPGKLADLVVLDENLFEMNREEIHDIEPTAVMMEGEWIHGGFPSSPVRPPPSVP